jgi:hypothetical protein
LQRGDLAIAPRAAEAFGVNEKDRAWVDRMCVGQPVATFTEKISLTGARDRDRAQELHPRQELCQSRFR